MRTADSLERRLASFTPERLSVDHRSGPPYDLPPEVDVERSIDGTRAGGSVTVHGHVLSEDQLRDPKTKVMFAFVPAEDFERTRVVDGVEYRDRMGDVMASMTGTANPPELTLHSVSPNYALEWLRANLPPGRVDFTLPETMARFEADFLAARPDLLLLSGLNVNTRALLRMALFARRNGVKEVWLGGDVALGPYRIFEEAFDRTIWGPGERFLRDALVGDAPGPLRHPEAERMLAGVKWLVPGENGSPRQISFDTLHVGLRLGCTRTCVYCAEGIKSNRGRAFAPTEFERFRELVDEALDRGVRRVYFVDPDFGSLWDEELEGRAIAYMAEKDVRWSILTNVKTLDRFGERMADHGLASIYLGIESLAPTYQNNGDRLSSLNRGWQETSETVRQVHRLADFGVMTMGLYILGNPGESIDDMWAGVQRLKDTVPLSQISTNQPFPGTAQFGEAARAGRIHDYDPDSIRYGSMVWTPEGRTAEPSEIERMYIRAHREVNDLNRPGGFFDRQKRARAAKGAAR